MQLIQIGTTRTALLAFLIAGFWFIVPHTHAAIDAKNIMGMWLFNEGEGGVATDSSGQGNDGDIHGAKWVDGKFGNALKFDGVDDWVEAPHSESLGFEAGTSFTITLHFKGTKVGGSLVGKNYEDKTQILPWYMLWDNGGWNEVTLRLHDDTGAKFFERSTKVVGDDEWHFIAGRADASTGKLSTWIDGKMEVEVDFNAESGYGTTEGIFHIGLHYERFTAGIIDDVVLFNAALDEADMKMLMDNGAETAAAVEAVDKLATTWGRLKRQK